MWCTWSHFAEWIVAVFECVSHRGLNECLIVLNGCLVVEIIALKVVHFNAMYGCGGADFRNRYLWWGETAKVRDCCCWWTAEMVFSDVDLVNKNRIQHAVWQYNISVARVSKPCDPFVLMCWSHLVLDVLTSSFFSLLSSTVIPTHPPHCSDLLSWTHNWCVSSAEKLAELVIDYSTL